MHLTPKELDKLLLLSAGMVAECLFLKMVDSF